MLPVTAAEADGSPLADGAVLAAALLLAAGALLAPGDVAAGPHAAIASVAITRNVKSRGILATGHLQGCCGSRQPGRRRASGYLLPVGIL